MIVSLKRHPLAHAIQLALVGMRSQGWYRPKYDADLSRLG